MTSPDLTFHWPRTAVFAHPVVLAMAAVGVALVAWGLLRLRRSGAHELPALQLFDPAAVLIAGLLTITASLLLQLSLGVASTRIVDVFCARTDQGAYALFVQNLTGMTSWVLVIGGVFLLRSRHRSRLIVGSAMILAGLLLALMTLVFGVVIRFSHVI